MDNTSVGKCRYCSNQIFYSGGKTLVTCPKCGETLVVAEFINEKKKLDDALAEGKKAREALQEAERERDESQQKLLKTLTVIEQLSDGQADSQRKLTQILENQGVSAEGQEAAVSLLCNIYKGQAQDRDVLTSLFREAMRNQKTAEEKLYSLQAAAEAISKSQNNISDLLQAVSNYLDTDVINRNRQIGELVSWTQSAHQEDVVRLEAISRTTLELASGQEKIGSRISELREAVAKTELAVRDFEKNWQQSELRKLMDLYQQAENCQMDREFERAEELYQQVLAFGGRDPEVYWRLILCHYCVVYQQDEEGKQVLTILYPDLTDPKEMSARKELKNCEQSEEQRAYYEKELAKLDKVLNKYREVRLERKYDVFISVKQTVWQKGKKYYTRDRELGSILYDHLTGMGLKVFNSEEQACKCPPGQEWEPYILAALLSSKVMIVVGTSAEYMESQWVKNEWQRFQWLRKKENRKGTSERKLLCFISDSMNPYDIPKGLNPDVQAIVNGVNALEQVDQAIKGMFPKDPSPSPVKPEQKNSNTPVIAAVAVLLMIVGIVLGFFIRSKTSENYTVSWVDEDGMILEIDEKVKKGEMPEYNGKTPEKAEDEAFTYQFSSWAPEIVPVTGDATYQATFSRSTRKYTITWTDPDGTLYNVEPVSYGSTPVHSDPVKEADDQYIYTFTGWAPEIIPVTRDATYQATFARKASPTYYDVGNYVTFGHYPQTSEGNDNTPIEWLVLARDGNKALLLSRYGLDAQPYNKEKKEITWEKCTLRSWLNGTFLNKAFTTEEQTGILLTNVDNSRSQGYGGYVYSDGGNNTKDKIFLLSYAEANKYFSVSEETRNMKSRISPTAYAIHAHSELTSSWEKTEDGSASGRWWLRSRGYFTYGAACIDYDGSLCSCGVEWNIICVRPALWINLEPEYSIPTEIVLPEQIVLPEGGGM